MILVILMSTIFHTGQSSAQTMIIILPMFVENRADFAYQVMKV